MEKFIASFDRNDGLSTTCRILYEPFLEKVSGKVIEVPGR